MPTLPDGVWAQLFAGLDLPVLAMIGIIAFVLHRSIKFPEWQAMAIPLGLGGIWGLVTALQAPPGIAGQSGAAPALIFKGVLMNGGGATVVGRLVDVALTKSGLWPASTESQVQNTLCAVSDLEPTAQAQVKDALIAAPSPPAQP